MAFKSPVWFPIAIVLSVINLVAVGAAALPSEPVHATVHAALALAFGLWAQRLRLKQGPQRSRRQVEMETLESEVNELRQKLSQTQDRLDFTEQLLANKPQSQRVGPER